jgi:uncharacterized protein (DUF488 family)
MTRQLYTIGHSNQLMDQFLALLALHQIEALADVRRFPGSRKFPQFNQASLSEALQGAGIEYHWFEALGGRRQKRQTESPNLGLENESFRNYADYMMTQEFQQGIDKLLEIADRQRTTIMCAEAVFWRCHRRLVSDFLLIQGVAVQHIMPTGELRPHELTAGAVMEGGKVTYPKEKSLFS